MNKRLAQLVIALSAVSIVIATGTTLSAQDAERSSRQRFPFPGAVYTMSNGADRNAILIFDRLPDGRLVRAGVANTGGTGTGAGLGNQGGLVLSGNEKWLLTVNAGSHSISVLQVHRRGLRLVDVQPSGGVRPSSVTEHRGLVYVLNAGSDSIAGFTLSRHGRLRPLDGSARPLSGVATDPAQIEFTPDGDVLVVTEKMTNKIVTFQVDRDGLPSDARVQDSTGPTPFGFAFGKRDQLFVSEAFGGAVNASATSSYEIDRDGVLTTISASVGTNQTAACWVVVTPNGRFAYVTNTGSGSISGYAIDFDGTIELLDEDGRTALTGDGSAPIDMAITDSGRFLYSLNSGTNTIGAFRIRSDGSLMRLPFTGGLPPGANGLAAR
jgi:6-phosphogluconolactonase (cycloisomerase 2 family)